MGMCICERTVRSRADQTEGGTGRTSTEKQLFPAPRSQCPGSGYAPPVSGLSFINR